MTVFPGVLEGLHNLGFCDIVMEISRILKVFLKVESTTFLGRVRVKVALSRTRASH